jgi:transcriptional regulator with XRE-family HTH domain
VAVQTDAVGMDARSLLAWNLRHLRSERGLSQERLAADAGIDRAYVSQIERRLFAASVDTLGKLADTLGVEVGRLFDQPPEGAKQPENLPQGRRRDA